MTSTFFACRQKAERWILRPTIQQARKASDGRCQCKDSRGGNQDWNNAKFRAIGLGFMEKDKGWLTGDAVNENVRWIWQAANSNVPNRTSTNGSSNFLAALVPQSTTYPVSPLEACSWLSSRSPIEYLTRPSNCVGITTCVLASLFL